MLPTYELGRTSAPSCASGLRGRVSVPAKPQRAAWVCLGASWEVSEKGLEELSFTQTYLGYFFVCFFCILQLSFVPNSVNC